MRYQFHLLLGATYCAILDQFNRLCAWCDKRLPNCRYSSYHQPPRPMKNDEALYQALLERIQSLTHQQMIEVGHALNRWETHDLIRDIMPDGWHWNGEGSIKSTPQAKVMDYITRTVGRRAELYYHNVTHRGEMTPDGFEQWWNSQGWKPF